MFCLALPRCSTMKHLISFKKYVSGMEANSFYALPQYFAMTSRTVGDNPKFLCILLSEIKLVMFCRGTCFPHR